MDNWHKSGCVLCAQNCGLEIKVEDNRIVKVRPDKDNPRSQGYACQQGAQRDPTTSTTPTAWPIRSSAPPTDSSGSPGIGPSPKSPTGCNEPPPNTGRDPSPTWAAAARAAISKPPSAER